MLGVSSLPTIRWGFQDGADPARLIQAFSPIESKDVPLKHAEDGTAPFFEGRVVHQPSHLAAERFSMLNFTTTEVNGVMVIAFEPTDDATYDWQSTQRDWLYKLIESHPSPLFAIDLSEVNYLASSEIGFLVTLKRRIDRRKGKSVLFGICPYIMDIFQTMNLHKVLDIVETQSAAVARLKA